MFSKINLFKIISDHIKTFTDATSGKFIISDFLVFIGIPIIVSIIVSIRGLYISNELITLLVTSLSIFAALLFNLLLLIYDIVRKGNDNKTPSEIKWKLLKEIYSNISFCILLSINAVIFLLAASITTNGSWVDQMIDIVITFLVSMFMLALFMILKRVHVLLSNEIK